MHQNFMSRIMHSMKKLLNSEALNGCMTHIMTLPKSRHQAVIHWFARYLSDIWLYSLHSMAKSVTSSSSISGGSCACASRCLWGVKASRWDGHHVRVRVKSPKHDETWMYVLVQFDSCSVQDVQLQVHVNLWRLSSTLDCSNVYDVFFSHKISRVLHLHSQSRFAASSFPMLLHDSRQPDAICRRKKHISRTSPWRNQETFFWHMAMAQN